MFPEPLGRSGSLVQAPAAGLRSNLPPSDFTPLEGALKSGDQERRPLPPMTRVDLLDVSYSHLKTSDDGDLYLTQFGQPFWEHLLPENWYAKEWFEANRERLVGTSTVYRVHTRPVNGRELNLVVKWSRVGEYVPLDTLTVNKFIDAEFNSPFEEFS